MAANRGRDGCSGCGIARRGALLAITALAGSAAAAKCKGVDAGPLKAFAKGTFKIVESDDGRFIVARDAKGLYAMFAVCTHMGGSIALVDDKGTTRCPSHGSVFDGNGEVVTGPAAKPLFHVAVTICDGRVRVEPGAFVPIDVRTAVA